MSKKRNSQVVKPSDNLRLNPEARIAPAFDAVSIKKFEAPKPGKMGFRVLDNCAEEHEM